MKKILALILVVAMLTVMCACGNTGNNSQIDTAVTVTDHNGNVVEFTSEINRIAVCDIFPLPSVISVFFDSAAKLVGIHPNSMSAAKSGLLSELYPEILNAETGFIKGTEVNTEELAKLKPDVVFYSASNPQMGTTLTNAGFKAVAVSAEKWNYNAIETLDNWILLLSQMFPNNNRYDKMKTYSDEIYNLVQSRVKDLKNEQKRKAFFLFQYTGENIMTSGKKFFGQWWAESIGAVNVAEELEKKQGAPVNMEQIYKWNPDLIFITNYTTAKPDDLYNNTVGNYDWSNIDAIKNKQAYKMPLGMYRSYTCGVDTPITLLWLAKAAYPKLFEDIDITQKTIDFYKTVFGIELTADQVGKIFAPLSNAGDVKL